jgi:hypothetical protein
MEWTGFTRTLSRREVRLVRMVSFVWFIRAKMIKENLWCKMIILWRILNLILRSNRLSISRFLSIILCITSRCKLRTQELLLRELSLDPLEVTYWDSITPCGELWDCFLRTDFSSLKTFLVLRESVLDFWVLCWEDPPWFWSRIWATFTLSLKRFFSILKSTIFIWIQGN